MRQVTLVALYRSKPPDLARLITSCQERIKDSLHETGTEFHEYDGEQVHATIVGLERVEGSARLNRNFMDKRRREATMDFAGLLSFLRGAGVFPFQVQIGGFRNREYPFKSRTHTPYERSFSIQGGKKKDEKGVEKEVGLAVVLGWPIRGKPWKDGGAHQPDPVWESRLYPATLDSLRQALQSFGILHAYHKELTDVDNDFFFRLGWIDRWPLDPQTQKEVEEKLRKYLARRRPIVVDVNLSVLRIASYADETLPLRSTKSWLIGDPSLTPEAIRDLYD